MICHIKGTVPEMIEICNKITKKIEDKSSLDLYAKIRSIYEEYIEANDEMLNIVTLKTIDYLDYFEFEPKAVTEMARELGLFFIKMNRTTLDK